MKKIRFAALFLAITLILTSFCSCKKKNAKFLNQDSSFPATLAEKGKSLELIVDSKSGYEWKYELESEDTFTVELEKKNDRKTYFLITPSETGIMNTLTLTLQRDNSKFSLACYKATFSFALDGEKKLDLLNCDFEELTGDVIYGEDTEFPYVLENGLNNVLDIKIILPDAKKEYAFDLSDDTIVTYYTAAAEEGLYDISFTPQSAGNTELYFFEYNEDEDEMEVEGMPVKPTTTDALKLTLTVDKNMNILVVNNGIVSYKTGSTVLESKTKEIESEFGKIKFPAQTEVTDVSTFITADTNKVKHQCCSFEMYYKDTVACGFSIISGLSAREAANVLKTTEQMKRLSAVASDAYSIRIRTGYYAVVWGAESDNAAFVVTAKDEDTAAEIAKLFAALKNSVKDIAPVENETAVSEKQ